MDQNERNWIDPAASGPFPPRQLDERPWDGTEAEWGPFERRRAGDRRAPDLEPAAAEGAETHGPAESRERRRRWGRRKSDVLSTVALGSLTADARRLVRRLREPLIGLTLAGVAAPLINAGVNPGEEGPRSVKGETEAGSVTGGDLEEGVGERWSEAEAETVRAQTIEGAVTRYGIDRTLAAEIYEAAERHEIEPDMAYGLVNTESTFRDRAVSHVGARGLTQVMPRTARWLDPSVSASELFNRDTNLDLGFKYLRMMIDKYGGDVENALTAYNRGPGTVDKILRRGGNPDNGYAGKVLGG
ncbi:MAG TPA: lytic transglycosylase domain-containing protein [Longimicrobiales bacterium]|nr:lytic transglycosylase domain-containing protein [Longimicrobiales bacterium]